MYRTNPLKTRREFSTVAISSTDLNLRAILCSLAMNSDSRNSLSIWLDSMKENWRPSKLELRVQEFARSNAAKQLLRVPYEEFARTAREYVRWEAFSLWIRAVLELEHQVPPVAHQALQQRCPGLLKRVGSIDDPAELNQRLEEWINKRKPIARARREGWFEAILFYSVRDSKLKYVYAYWEHCGRDWANKGMHSYPEFGTWLQSAFKRGLFPVDAKRFSKAVDSYLDWLSVAYWLEPLLEYDCVIPARLVGEMKQRGRGFSELAKRLDTSERCEIATRFHLMSWTENRNFSEAQEEKWLEPLRRCAQNHPRYARVSEYARRWRVQRPQDCLRRYPSFVNWCGDAENFVERH